MRLFVFNILILTFNMCYSQVSYIDSSGVTCDGETVIHHKEVLKSYPAQFPGGDSALEIFVNNNKLNILYTGNFSIPFSMAIEVFIDKSGGVNKDSIILGHDEEELCPACALEARRLVKIMPPWIPAYRIKRGKKEFCSSRRTFDIPFFK
jgi:hypothetical protein